MNTRTTYALIAILAAVLSFSTSSAFAGSGFYDEKACPDCDGEDVYQKQVKSALAEMPITVRTDKAMYGHDAVIMVEGTVANLREGVPVTLSVTSPKNNIVTIEQVMVNDDKTFKTNLKTSGNLWKYDGTYIIKVQYGSSSVNNKALFELTGGITDTPTVTCSTNELTVKGNCVPYRISGATVTGSSVNVGAKSLTVTINSVNEGTISLDIPRAVLDAKMTNGNDDQFFVLVDGEETEYDETSTASVRTLTIAFPAGAEEIEIVGTFVIPEFGTIAALILVVAIVSIIAITAKTRLNVLPKY